MEQYERATVSVGNQRHTPEPPLAAIAGTAIPWGPNRTANDHSRSAGCGRRRTAARNRPSPPNVPAGSITAIVDHAISLVNHPKKTPIFLPCTGMSWSRNRSRAGRGLVHFSAETRYCREKRKPKTWTCPLTGRRGQSPVNGYVLFRMSVIRLVFPETRAISYTLGRPGGFVS